MSVLAADRRIAFTLGERKAELVSGVRYDRVPVIPAVGVVEQAPSAYQGAGGRQASRSIRALCSSTLNDQRSLARGHGHRGRLNQPDNSATLSCGSAMNPSSDIVLCETTLPIGTSCGGLHDDERYGRSGLIGWLVQDRLECVMMPARGAGQG
jgi:hypothetical protein